MIGLDVEVNTKIGADFPPKYVKDFQGWGFDAQKWTCGKPTTRFVLDYTSEPKKISVDAVCEPLRFPGQHFESVKLSPIVGEITPEQVQSLDSGFMALDPQGIIRKIYPSGVIQMEPWTPETFGGVDLLKTSSEEHAYVTGTHDPERSLKVLAGKGVGVAIITQGSMGSLVYSGDTFYHVPIYPSKVVDTTGAGDCYLAGVASVLIKGGPVDWACAYGSALSSAIIETKGSNLELSGKEITERAEFVYEKIEKN